MNKQINNYVNTLFNDIPKTKKAIDLKEEIISNMNDRYSDYISEGLSTSEAYKLTIANFGDFDEMLKEVMPTEDFKAKVESFRKRNAMAIAFSVVLYIVSPVAFFAVNGFDVETLPNVGLGVVALLTMVAIATGIIVYTSLSTPLEIRKYLEEVEDEKNYRGVTEGQKALINLFWCLVTVIYFSISYLTGAWGITWLIWIFANAAKESLVYMFRKNNNKDLV